MAETIYTERGAVIALKEGQTVLVRGIGNSMTPILKSGEISTVAPITDETVIDKGDIVLATVNGKTYLHKVTGIKKFKKRNLYQISNNHGHVNGWTAAVHGKLITPPSSNGQDTSLRNSQ